jgi:hypothetical protein
MKTWRAHRALLWTRQWDLWLRKRRAISWPVERLSASYDGLCSIDLAFCFRRTSRSEALVFWSVWLSIRKGGSAAANCVHRHRHCSLCSVFASSLLTAGRIFTITVSYRTFVNTSRFFTSVQYGCHWLCGRPPDEILNCPAVCPRKWHLSELWR